MINSDKEWTANPTLRALTWVDPVTVVDVDLAGVAVKMKDRRLLELEQPFSDQQPPGNRRLGGESQSPKSNIHGTNGYMVPLPSSGELLGLAHFHRPEHRQASDYALHGHHYTHSFFTIARDSGGSFKLKRLSNEFAFRSMSTHSASDADIIQFASGLDVVGSDNNGQLIISYGINDCEGAVVAMPMEKLQQMLVEVEQGQEVVELMQRIQT